eukprot:TRINITY_DN5484_c0_g2_i1.p1 TRINITY_DN5484_c0_g2~~TRINITY_DN5484_c0_g2_i1.p1  ORF type:complete len:780 (+),score=258.42 TRINITY_DN5484_c0_g2_i1:102-2342(+)
MPPPSARVGGSRPTRRYRGSFCRTPDMDPHRHRPSFCPTVDMDAGSFVKSEVDTFLFSGHPAAEQRRKAALLRKAFAAADEGCTGTLKRGGIIRVLTSLGIAEEEADSLAFGLTADPCADFEYEELSRWFFASRAADMVPLPGAGEARKASSWFSFAGGLPPAALQRRGSAAGPLHRANYGAAAAVAKAVVPDPQVLRIARDLAMGMGLSEVQIDVLRRIYRRIDTSGCGRISVAQVQELYSLACPELDEAQVHEEVFNVWADLGREVFDTIDFEEELVKHLRSAEDDVGSLLVSSARMPIPDTPREWVWAVFDHKTGGESQLASLRWVASTVMVTLQVAILLSVILMLLDSMPDFQRRVGEGDSASGVPATIWLERCCLSLFTLEFFARSICTPNYTDYWSSGSTWIDFAAIAPFWLWLALGAPSEEEHTGLDPGSLVALRVIRLVKISRITRVLKLGRHSVGVQLMLVALVRARLALTWLMVLLMLAMVFFSTLLWNLEKVESRFYFDRGFRGKGAWVRDDDSVYADRGQEIAFQSIPDTLWWSLVTLTTVGYGDSYPITEGGKVVAGLCMVTGLLVIAYPTTLLCNVFAKVFQEYEDKRVRQVSKCYMDNCQSSPSPPPEEVDTEFGRGSISTEILRAAECVGQSPGEVLSNGRCTEVPDLAIQPVDKVVNEVSDLEDNAGEQPQVFCPGPASELPPLPADAQPPLWAAQLGLQIAELGAAVRRIDERLARLEGQRADPHERM